MKFPIAFAMASLAMADYQLPPWHPQGEGEVRSPCPGINALANHGIIPRDGKNLSHDIILSALPGALGLNPDISEALFQMALATTPNPQNATTFNLDDVNRHNFIEIDASLSRGDAYFGDDHSFNQTIFDQTKSYWKGSIINYQNAADAFAARVRTSKATNPEFSLTSQRLLMGAGASGLFTVVFGKPGAGVVEKSWIVELFENERLPADLGWRKREDVISTEELGNLTTKILDASGVAGEAVSDLARRFSLIHGLSS